MVCYEESFVVYDALIKSLHSLYEGTIDVLSALIEGCVYTDMVVKIQ